MRFSRSFIPALVSALIVGFTAGLGQDASHWVTTWGASPLAPHADDPGFDDETVRLIVHTSVGGDAVRVRLSNEFGTENLVVGEARIAHRTKDAEIAPGTDRALAIGGARSFTVPPGKTVLTDPVKLDVPALGDLAVSLYFPKRTGPSTMHALACSQSYVAAKNAAGAHKFPTTATRPHWYYLMDVEVATKAPVPAIVAFGDSITDGMKSTPGTNHRWPNLLSDRLAKAGMTIAVVDAGIAGNGLVHGIVGPKGLARFDQDVLEQTGVKFVIVLLGINDIGNSERPEYKVTLDELIAGYKDLVSRAHARGLKIFAGTLLPFGGSFYDPKPGDPRDVMRAEVNKFLRTGGAFDGVIDFAAAVRDPAHPRVLLAKYDSGDHLHPNDAGMEAMAAAIDLEMFGAGHGEKAGGGDENDDTKVALERARASWDALEKSFAVPREPGHYHDGLDGTKPAFIWTQSEVLHAALNLEMVAHDEKIEKCVEDAAATIAEYKLTRNGTTAYAPTPHPPKNARRFWDDNGWLGLTLLQASYQSKTPKKYVDLVAEMFPFYESGQVKPGGGQYWQEDDPKPNLGIPQAGSDDQVALRLHMASHESGKTRYYAFAELNEHWVNTTLHVNDGPLKGLYYNSWYPAEADNPTKTGHVCEWLFTYNQGFPIGADLLRYRISGDKGKAFLDRATATANAALDHFTPDELWKQPAPFNAVLFRNLLALDHDAPDPRYRKALAAYLDRAWKEGRDQSTGVFHLGGIGLFGKHATALNQAAFVQMFSLLAWPRERLPDAT
jgi:lysophospholipase L1-like esterase